MEKRTQDMQNEIVMLKQAINSNDNDMAKRLKTLRDTMNNKTGGKFGVNRATRISQI